MKIIFNELGVITSIDTTDEPIRQGNVGVNNLIVDFSNMNGVNNLDYSCVFTYVRPDKSKINDVIMLSSAENTKYFEFNFSNKWFFELYGDASITVKLLKDNTVLANGEFNIVIEKTSADNEPQITYDEYLHLVESITKTQQDAKQYTDDSVQALKDLVSENYAEKTYVDNQLNLCVKLTDIDTDLSLTSTNPIQNKVVSKQIKDINYTIMTIKEELFETVLSEIDYKVDYATIYPIPDTLSDDDGIHRVVYSDTQLKEIEGNSVAFNQLVQNGNFVDASGWSAENITKSVADNKMTGTCNGDNKSYLDIFTHCQFIKDHKYLIKATIKTSVATTSVRFALLNSNYKECGYKEENVNVLTKLTNSVIVSCFETDTNGFIFYKVYGTFNTGDTVEYENCQLLDLTLMGLDSITTVEEFNRIFPLTYYPYNAGEIKSTIIKGVKVNGYNLFDGELELNYRYDDNGNKVSTLKNILSTNYIRVIAGQTYTLTFSNLEVVGTSYSRSIYQFDSNYNYIKSTHNYGTFASAFNITLESNCAYIKFNAYDNGGISTIPTNPQICLHITGSRTGYAPYKEPRIIQIPQTKLLSAGSVHDTIKIVEGNVVAGQQRYNMVCVSKTDNVDLGTLNWAYVNDVSCFRATTDISDIKQVSANNIVFNGICSKYKTTDYATNTLTNIKAISLQKNEKRVWIQDRDLGTNATAFKQAMSGVILNYEKVEPTETTLATDLTFEEVSAIIEQGGSIETVFEIVPPNLKTAFVVNKAIVS